ncbi:MAG: right-handed parallel beta-helix repeat-containing protein [Phycisphaerales bacterium]|nr:right-handed parallel beta-helix repeat-containing protein [Phycisphaerales bacterium]
MKQLWIMGVVGVMSVGAPAQAQTIVQGPVANPGNGHHYYVVQGADWTQLEAFAQTLGGHLATVESLLESDWINANLTNSQTRKLFLGLSDAALEGTFVWADGSTSVYRNWRSGQPASDDYVMTQPSAGGQWDATIATATSFGVVELPGSIKVPGDYATIQAAIDAAYPGATIEVSPGTYNEGLLFAKAVRVVSTCGACATTVKLSGSGRRVEFANGTTTETTLEGFTITGSTGESAIWAYEPGASGRVARCVITRNTMSIGAGIFLGNRAGMMTFENCVISENSGTTGAAIHTNLVGSNSLFVNCLITGNNGGACIQAQGGTVTFRNCTIADNANHSPSGVSAIHGGRMRFRNCIARQSFSAAPDSEILATYTNVQDGWPGVGNFDADPMFQGAGVYSLAAGSPCIDAGDIGQYSGFGPTTDLGGDPRAKNDPATPNTGVGVPPIDIGAYEFQPLDPNCPADFNGDGFVNGDDYDAFVEHFEEGC